MRGGHSVRAAGLHDVNIFKQVALEPCTRRARRAIPT